MIQCVDGSVLPLDERALGKLLDDDFWRSLRFDQDYLAALPAIHGGTPVKSYFTDANGTVRRVGWFVSMYDEESELPGPAQEDHMYHDDDTRIVDRSLPYLLGGESSIYWLLEEGPIWFYPFAALYEDAHDEGSAPVTLAWHFGDGSDSLCFDTSTEPFSIVYCNFRRAVDEFHRWDSEFGQRVRLQPSPACRRQLS